MPIERRRPLDRCPDGILRGRDAAAGFALSKLRKRGGDRPVGVGAVDLAIGARNVFVMMDHLTKSGESKITPTCTNPVTALACVNRIYTDLAVIDVRPDGLAVVEIVDGLPFDELQRLTGVPLRRAAAA